MCGTASPIARWLSLLIYPLEQSGRDSTGCALGCVLRHRHSSRRAKTTVVLVPYLRPLGAERMTAQCVESEFEEIRRFEPPVAPPTQEQVLRQRGFLMAVAASEGIRPGGRGRRRISLTLGAGVLGVTLAAGTAAATGLFSPRQADVSAVTAHYNQRGPYSGGSSPLRAGARPVLDSEQVACEYAQSANRNEIPEAFISSSPMSLPLTAAMIVQGCVSRSPAVGAPTLCTLAAPTSTEGPGGPVVVFGRTCTEANENVAPPDLVDRINAQRAIEAQIDAVPSGCPTKEEATTWVNSQLANAHLSLRIQMFDGGVTASCYVPHVHWWSMLGGYVDVAAEYETASPLGTLPPPIRAPVP